MTLRLDDATIRKVILAIRDRAAPAPVSPTKEQMLVRVLRDEDVEQVLELPKECPAIVGGVRFPMDATPGMFASILVHTAYDRELAKRGLNPMPKVIEDYQDRTTDKWKQRERVSFEVLREAHMKIWCHETNRTHVWKGAPVTDKQFRYFSRSGEVPNADCGPITFPLLDHQPVVQEIGEMDIHTALERAGIAVAG